VEAQTHISCNSNGGIKPAAAEQHTAAEPTTMTVALTVSSIRDWLCSLSSAAHCASRQHCKSGSYHRLAARHCL
jgi:hypothetical protein